MRAAVFAALLALPLSGMAQPVLEERLILAAAREPWAPEFAAAPACASCRTASRCKSASPSAGSD